MHTYIPLSLIVRLYLIQNGTSPNEYTADEGGATRMSGGVPWITLPAGYLGSSFIGAALITCGFNENASKVASLVLAGFFPLTLWWARRSWMFVLRL